MFAARHVTLLRTIEWGHGTVDYSVGVPVALLDLTIRLQ
jgi:hypothetical protein